ncbi:putative polysaccharide biosynthesis protein [Shouchella shacheensis]|uniref:putative polysaccharide biosynthesis protein n=1 Tax=Shouchella shacheensis TaxID=1649580 RepID=UPI0007401CAB|nr:polysaccharide biosynthesis protein [Shouchella shacheensis]
MSEPKQDNQSLIKGAMLLTLAALMAKILSAGYRIPFQNMAGDMGFYVYQQVYPFYGVMTTLALYGFPVVISRQLAQARAKGLEKEARLSFALAIAGLAVLSLLSAFLFFFFAPQIAFVMGDEQLTGPLRLVGTGFLFLPILSALRGFGQGHEQMGPTALSHVGEQLVRVTCILLFAYLLLEAGAGAYGAGQGAVYGSLAGSAAACTLLLVSARRVRWREWVRISGLSLVEIARSSGQVLMQSLFICLNALILLLFQLVDVFTVIRLLGAHGMSETSAYLAKGIYDRSQPLLQLGTILTTTVALALVPLLAKAVGSGQYKEARRYRDVALRLALLIGGSATIGLFVIMEPVNAMLFTDSSGSNVLRVMATAIVIGSLYMSAAAILQGYGYTHIPAISIAYGLFVKLVANFIFIPLYGTMGAAIANVLAFSTMAIIVLAVIRRVDQKIMVSRRAYAAIGITLVFLAAGAYGWKMAAERILISTNPSRLTDTLIALSTSLVGGLIVLACLAFLPILSEQEWKEVPKLDKLRRLIAPRK